MTQFFGVLRHEFRMSVRRPGMWIAYAILYIFYGITVFSPGEIGTELPKNTTEMWQYAGYAMLYCNMFMVILGGILAADRAQRDYRLGLRELQKGSPLSQTTYLLSKYFAVLASVMIPMLLFVIGYAAVNVILGVTPLFFLIVLAAFIVMAVPAFAFVTAFSIACPLFMPVRVYQVLFVGYWFWGNYLSPEVLPTLSETLLVPSGKVVFYGLLCGFPENLVNFKQPIYTHADVAWNLVILFSIIITVLVLTISWLRRETRKA